MQQLPVPLLHNTLDHYLTWVRPLLTDNEYAQTSQVVENFRKQDGPKIQSELEIFANEKKESSWLIDYWIASYLSGRKSVTLESNVSIELEFPELDNSYSPLEKIARFIVAHGQLHADYFSGKLESILVAESNLCRQQLKILEGVSRVPCENIDGYYFNPKKKGEKSIAVYWNQDCYLIPIIDENGMVPTLGSVIKTLAKIIEKSALESDVPFNAFSFLDGAHAGAIFEKLLLESANQKTLAKIQSTLFNVTLFDDSITGIEANRRATFDIEFWAYKPLSYLFNLKTEVFHQHVEHTWEDAGILVDLHRYAKKLIPRLFCESEEKIDGLIQMSDVLSIEPLQWKLSASLISQVRQEIEIYYTNVLQFSMIKTSFAVDLNEVTFRFSKDAFIQFVMQYAQLYAFNSIGNTYEAVDMREFSFGRTECVRPVSIESVLLVDALDQETKNSNKTVLFDYFQRAELEHRNRIKLCKQGLGVNRHLLGLQFTAEKMGLDPAIFNDVGYQRFTTDRLSTTTLGANGITKNIGFVPTSKNGLGINYLFDETGIHFFITYYAAQEEKIRQFIEGLKIGSEKISALLTAQ